MRRLQAPDYPLLTAEEFLAFDFGKRKAELDNGVIRMMAGCAARHVAVAGNVLVRLMNSRRGAGFTAYNSSLAVRTRDHSVRRPDVAVYCGRNDPVNDDLKAFDDPRVLFEVLSAGTARIDLRVKLEEYKELPSVDAVVFVDIATERLRVVRRTGPDSWSETIHRDPVDLDLPTLGLTLPHAELFARD